MNLKSEKGVTLIILIVMVIVMFIISAVVIDMAIKDDDGVIDAAKDARSEANEVYVNETNSRHNMMNELEDMVR